MDTKSQTQKRQVGSFSDDSILESLRGVGSSVIKTSGDAASKISSDVLASLFGSLPKTGELKADQPVHLVERQPTPAFSRKPDILAPRTNIQELNLKQQIDSVRMELKGIAASLKSLHTDIEKTINEVPVDPGVYHVNFFARLRSFLKLLREQIDDSSTWLKLSSNRKKKKGYWGMVKKHGTSFGLSNERSIATAAG